MAAQNNTRKNINNRKVNQKHHNKRCNCNTDLFSSRKEDFVLLFDFIDDEYQVSTYNFDLKEPEKVSLYKNTEFYDIIRTEISAHFQTDSQIKLLMFLEEMINRIPGYVHTKVLDFAHNDNKINGFFVLDVYTLKLKT